MMNSKKQPNVIFILIDDMGWTDLGCFGSSFYETPNIDKLARSGIIYPNAYAASPVCSPSRASVMTGKYPLNVGITNWCGAGLEVGNVIGLDNNGELGNQEQTIANTLKDHGYQTWHVGKWHLGDNEDSLPQSNGFDVNIGGCAWGHPKNGYFSPYKIPNLPEGPENEYLTDRMTKEAIALIKQKSDRPFYLNLWYYTVHTPIQAKADKIAKYEQKRLDMGLDQIDALEVGEYYRCEHQKQWRVKRRNVQSNPIYAAMVEHLDDNVGLLFNTLEEEGLLDDTIVIFTSDNGGLSTGSAPTSNKPLQEGKGWMYEGGVRVPLFVWYGDKVTPHTNNTVVNSTDYFNTILSLLDIEQTTQNDGFDFSKSLTGESLKRPPLYWYYPHYGNQGGAPYAAVRLDDWKLIRQFDDNSYELYNLSDDIGEIIDIASDHPDKVSVLKELLNNWLTDRNAYIPVPNPNWIDPNSPST
jgi:arylsulfatase A-like enzyme